MRVQLDLAAIGVDADTISCSGFARQGRTCGRSRIIGSYAGSARLTIWRVRRLVARSVIFDTSRAAEMRLEKWQRSPMFSDRITNTSREEVANRR